MIRQTNSTKYRETAKEREREREREREKEVKVVESEGARGEGGRQRE